MAGGFGEVRLSADAGNGYVRTLVDVSTVFARSVSASVFRVKESDGSAGLFCAMPSIEGHYARSEVEPRILRLRAVRHGGFFIHLKRPPHDCEAGKR